MVGSFLSKLIAISFDLQESILNERICIESPYKFEFIIISKKMNNLNPVFERSHSVPGVDTYVGVPSRISLAMLLGPPPLSIDHFFVLGNS